MVFKRLLAKTHDKIGNTWVDKDWPVDDHVKDLLRKGEPVGLKEWDYPMNGYERHLLVPLATKEVVMERLEYALQNCSSPCSKPAGTYEEAIIAYWAPRLLEILKEEQRGE